MAPQGETMNSERRAARQSPDRSHATKVLSVDDLSVAYSGGSISALEGVSLDVFEGEIVALLGVNGAGKTTLLRAISGLLGIHGGTIAGGAIRYRDSDVSGESAWARVRKGISISLEGRRVFTDLSVRDNLKAGGYIQSKPAAAKAYENVVELFPVLARKKDLPAGLLSGGEQQMLAVGRALMQGPRLLLLDEPSLGLAPLIVNQIRDIIVEINGQGCSVLLIEQNVATAMSIADYAYVLDSRRVQHQGTAAALLEDDTLRDLYLGIAPPAAGQKIENGARY
jgi:branched-chain amino acid transport system ATP-binding protein